jgi:hypothetical protein
MASDVPSEALAKYFRGNPPEEPERFYRLTREGNWLRRSEGATFLAVSRRKIASHARVRYRAVRAT